jgi:uncharacterized protein YjiS (DUF1127 family)
MTSYLSTLFRRSAQRKTFAALMNLDDHLLADIGLTRTDLHRMKARQGNLTGLKARAHE